MTTTEVKPSVPAAGPAHVSPPPRGAEPSFRSAHRPHAFTRVVMVAGILATLVAIGIFLWLRNSAKPAYTTVRLDRGDIDSTVTTTGNLNAVITVQVGSQVSGNITALHADFNTKVKKGQLVAEIDPAPFQAAVDQAAANLKAAQAAVVTSQAALAKSQSDVANAQANVASQNANLAKAQSVVDLTRVQNSRQQRMLAAGIAAQQEADTAQAAYDQAQAGMVAARAAVNAAEAGVESARKQVDVATHQLAQAAAVVQQAEAILAQARLNLAHTRILAPVDGTVESRNMDVGQTVAASFQAPTIFLIAQDLTKMQVDTNVDEADVGRVRVGQEATFTVDAWPSQVFRGRVSQIRQAPINVQNVVTYNVVVQVSNEDLKLFPGMTANVTVFVGRAANVLRLPKAALRFRPAGAPSRSTTAVHDAQTVWVLDARGQLKPVPVKTGMSDANFVEVVSGDLSAGQPVVTGVTGAAATPTRTNTRTPGRPGF